MIALTLVLAQAIVLPERPVTQFGVGVRSCATAMDGNQGQRVGWILGFWTGLNIASGRTVGKTSDGRGLVGEVERECALQPARPLDEVTLHVYQMMAKAGR